MKSTFARLLRYLGESKALLAGSLFSAVIAVAAALVAPAVVGRAVDGLAQAGQVDVALLGRTLALLVGLYLANSLFTWVLSLLTNRVAYRTTARLRQQLFERLTILPLKFFDRTARGDTVSRFVNDVDVVTDGLLQSLVALLQGVLTVLGAVGFMLAVNGNMTLVVVLSAPAAYYVARFVTKGSQQAFREQAGHLGKLNGLAQEMIEGQRVVKAFGYEGKAAERFAGINADLYRTGVKAQFISSLANPSTRIVNNIAYAAIGLIGGLWAIRGHVTVGEISAFVIYSVLFGKPFSDITGILSQMQAAGASAQRLFRLMDEEPEPPEAEGAIELGCCTGHVRFWDVAFAYDPARPLIQCLNLDIHPGCKVAIVGRTGAGKTTLVNLLMRFYDVDEGAIFVDGVDIRHLTRESLRRQFGMVLQDTWLFDGTIRDNIAYARPDATMDEVMEAARQAGAHGFIRRLEHGYDTVIQGEGGTLSQGQMQLLAIARVMLANPSMLILDEATSSIDPFTEQRVQKAFDRLTQGRTSFVIAHRLSTVRNADLILVMEGGRVVESGNHDELLHSKGQYARLYESQFAGQADFDQ